MKVDIRRPKLQRNAIISRAPLRIARASPIAIRIDRSIARRDMPRTLPVPPIDAGANFLPDPYVDYQRILTPQGGIAMIYKDLDMRWRHTLMRLFLWSAFTSFEAWLLFGHLQVPPGGFKIICMICVAVINWLIVAKPVEVYRSIEVRPDCMILDDSDVFWAHMMEGGWPDFRLDTEGNQVLCGVYGTRFIEYFIVRRFDELDRTPEVLAGHLQDALRQLWTWPY